MAVHRIALNPTARSAVAACSASCAQRRSSRRAGRRRPDNRRRRRDGLAGRELAFCTAWALGSVGAISFFPLLDNVAVLRVLGENDQGASAHAIEIVSRRWRAAGRRVRFVMPTAGFDDLNDVLIAERAAS